MPTFTARELDIMTAIWRLGPVTVGQVRDALATDGIDLAYNTVLTMLRILQEKGHVAHVAEGRAHVYRSLVEREDASRSALTRLLDGLFDRSPEALLVHLVDSELAEGDA
jgi:predicted transcriptional regulator